MLSPNRARCARVLGRVALVVSFLSAAGMCLSVRAAVPLSAGDIVVADQNSANGFGQIVKVTRTTGSRTLIYQDSTYTVLSTPLDVAYLNGMLYVPDDSLDRIDRVNPNDGSITMIKQFPSSSVLGLMTVDAAGQLLVTDTALHQVYRVNPATGATTVVSSGGILNNPFGIATNSSGQILVTDYAPTPRIISIDPVSGAQSVVTSGGLFNLPRGLAVEASGNVVVVDQAAFGGNGGVIRVNPTTGVQTLVSTGGRFGSNIDLALESSGSILVSMTSSTVNPAGGGVLRVDQNTGIQQPLSYANGFLNPGGLTVVPEPGMLPLLTLAIPLIWLASRHRRGSQPRG